jgi:hypothetical protein
MCIVFATAVLRGRQFAAAPALLLIRILFM